MKTTITKRAPNRFRSGQPEQPLNGVHKPAPVQPAPSTTTSPGPFPYTPAALLAV